ncbi:NAC domain-containing protein 2-like [Rutidosis leptorrhynchoides]|uniref:NAC domain-containing protein 2-like n=1 Tax=Rutidosis leptorrhynchoides TaxID=125765 RepID=UPI003A990326
MTLEDTGNNSIGGSLCSHCGRRKVTKTMSSELKATTEAYYSSGYHFHPTDEQLIQFYLLVKIQNANDNAHLIGNVNIYRYHLEHILENYPQNKEGYWYVFTPRNKVSVNSVIPNRIATCGYWNTIGNKKDIYDDNGTKIGTKECLVYYEGNPRNGTKTDWIMEEYVSVFNPLRMRYDDALKLDYVLCKIYNKKSDPMSMRLQMGVTEDDEDDETRTS